MVLRGAFGYAAAMGAILLIGPTNPVFGGLLGLVLGVGVLLFVFLPERRL